MERYKNNRGIHDMHGSSLADPKTENREQVKRKRYAQMQYGIPRKNGTNGYIFLVYNQNTKFYNQPAAYI